MMRKLRNELKIAGVNLHLISAALALFLVFLAVTAGNLLDVSGLGFGALFPFYAAMAVGEFGKTRADDNYDVIAAQSRSLFQWVLCRFLAVWGTVSMFAAAAMAAVSFIRGERAFIELLRLYFPNSFFLSSLSAWIGMRYSQEHISALVCGIIWLVLLLTNSLF